MDSEKNVDDRSVSNLVLAFDIKTFILSLKIFDLKRRCRGHEVLSNQQEKFHENIMPPSKIFNDAL
jgi:hypothetical protein